MTSASFPGLGASLRMGLRAALREGWLLPVGASIALVRALSTVPAFALAAALVMNGAGEAVRLRPLSLGAPFEGAAAVASSPRFLALVGGLWLAGTLLSGLLRILFVAGALPTLGASVSGIDATRRFAAGAVWGLPRQLGTALLALLGDVGAGGYLVAAAVGAGRVIGVRQETFHPLLLAGVGALALCLGVGGLLASRVLGDAAAARAAILGESPLQAFAGAARRFVAVPGAFLLSGFGVALAGLAVGSVLQPATAAVAGLAGRVDGSILLGPQLMLGLLSVLGGAAVELVWLASVSALACAEAPGPRVSA